MPRLVLAVVAALLALPGTAHGRCSAADARTTIEVVSAAGGPARAVAEQRTCSGGLAGPVFAPRGDAVLAVAQTPRWMRVVRAPVAGGAPARVVMRRGEAAFPVLAPGGAHVADLEFPRGARLAVVVRAVRDGRVVTRLEQRADVGLVLETYADEPPYAWSADGRRFAAVLPGRRRDELVVVDAPTGRVVLRRRLPGIGLAPDAFAADGASLAVTARASLVAPTARAHAVDLVTGVVRRLGRWAVTPPYGGVTPLPGDRLAWERDEALVLADPAGRRRLPVAALGPRVRVAGPMRVSPDGATAAFAVAAGGGWFAPTGVAVQSLAPGAGPPRLVVPFRRRGVGDPVWSPDGTRLAFGG